MPLLLPSSHSYAVAMAYSSITRWPGSPANKRRPSYAQKAGRSLARRAPWQLPKEPQKWCQKTRPARAHHPYPLSILLANSKKLLSAKRVKVLSRALAFFYYGCVWRVEEEYRCVGRGVAGRLALLVLVARRRPDVYKKEGEKGTPR